VFPPWNGFGRHDWILLAGFTHRIYLINQLIHNYLFLQYNQTSSLETTCEVLSVVASTLANGGVCPITGERVLNGDVVADVLSVLFSCGMLEFSGKFAFRVSKKRHKLVSIVFNDWKMNSSCVCVCRWVCLRNLPYLDLCFWWSQMYVEWLYGLLNSILFLTLQEEWNFVR